MEIDDYVADSTYAGRDNNNLLEDNSLPNPNLTDYRDLALANIAAVVHQNAPKLRADQAEMVVKWVKAWKAKQQPLKHHNTGNQFMQVLQTLRDSPEQVKLQKQAYRHTLLARLWGLAFAICGAITLGMFLIDGQVKWYWWLLVGITGLFCLDASDENIKLSTLIYKEQDRKYFLQSIREAQTLSELLDAGLFAYVPDAQFAKGQPFDMVRERIAVRECQERLTDALYRDTDDFMSTWYLEKGSLTGSPARSVTAI